MKAILITLVTALLLTGCTKMADIIVDKGTSSNTSSTPGNSFVRFTIPKGSQYCNGNAYRPLELAELKFIVKFDSTAIYQCLSPENQYDINKLYGFSDNNMDHHQYSARFGWRWSNNALRLFAYVYNGGKVSSKELATVAIGAETVCSIKAEGDRYLFRVNEVATELPRTATTPKAKGYQLYPYFGGDETAPHEITIWIRNLD